MISDKTQQMLWNCESQASGCDFDAWLIRLLQQRNVYNNKNVIYFSI